MAFPGQLQHTASSFGSTQPLLDNRIAIAGSSSQPALLFGRQLLPRLQAFGLLDPHLCHGFTFSTNSRFAIRDFRFLP